MQTMVVKPGEAPPFTGIVDCARKTIAREGPLGMYRGVAAPLANAVPVFAVCFWGYDLGKTLARSITGNQAGALSTGEIMFAGGFSAVPATLFMAPGERIKCLLQVQAEAVQRGEAPKYSGFTDCLRKVYRSGGVASLYRGWEATLLRDVPGSVAYFGVYELAKRSLTPADGKASPAAVLCAGGLAGVGNWVVSLPPDIIKSRIQTAPEGTYRGFAHAARVLVRDEGVGAFYKGVGPAMVRAFPANAACFFGVEVATSVLDWLVPTK